MQLEVRRFEQRQAGQRESVRGFLIATPKNEKGASFVVARNDGPLTNFALEAAARMVQLYNASLKEPAPPNWRPGRNFPPRSAACWRRKSTD